MLINIDSVKLKCAAQKFVCKTIFRVANILLSTDLKYLIPSSLAHRDIT